MSIWSLRQLVSDPDLHKAWKAGRAYMELHVRGSECELTDPAEKRLLANAFTRSALRYLEEFPTPKKEVIMFLLGAPALLQMEPADAVMTFGEVPAAIHAELELYDGESDVSRLSAEAFHALHGFARQLQTHPEWRSIAPHMMNVMRALGSMYEVRQHKIDAMSPRDKETHLQLCRLTATALNSNLTPQ